MNFQEFLKLQEDACTTASVGNTPGVDSGFGKNPPKDKKMAKRKPLPEENELDEGIGVKRANPGQQQGHTAGARRGSTPMHDEPPAKMSKGAMDILKKHISADELDDHQLHPDDKTELENHFKGQKTMKNESYKIGDRVEILREGFKFGKVTGINEEDGSLYVDPNSPLSSSRSQPILNLGLSEVEPFVNLRESLVSLKATIIQEAEKKDAPEDDDDDGDKKDDDKKDDDKKDDDKKDDTEEVDEDTKLILADLSLLKESTESSIRMVAVKYSAMSDLTIKESIEKVTAIFEEHKDAINEAYDWTPEKLKELHGKDKKKWSALKVNRPDLKDKMGEVENAHKSASKPAPKVEVDHFKVARVIDDAIGHAYPDGDPIDHIHPKMKAMGIKDEHTLKHLDTAAKKHLGAKGYHDHVANAWDQYNSDTGSKDKNPWH